MTTSIDAGKMTREDLVIYCKERIMSHRVGEVINNYHMEQLPAAGLPIRSSAFFELYEAMKTRTFAFALNIKTTT
jgi:hypothetical protein